MGWGLQADLGLQGAWLLDTRSKFSVLLRRKNGASRAAGR
jgi:hypothetical protein